jgi:MFS family permease
MTIMAEITPTDKRGRHMAILAVSLGLGQLFGIFLTSLCLDSNLKGGNWRLLIFLSGVPGFVSLVL